MILATGATPRTIPGTPDLDGIYVLRTHRRLARSPSRARQDTEPSGGRRAPASSVPRSRRPPGSGGSRSRSSRRCRCRSCARSAITWARRARPSTRTTASRCARTPASTRSRGPSRVERVRLSDGSTLDADVVVVGIGVVPNTKLARGIRARDPRRRRVRRDARGRPSRRVLRGRHHAMAEPAVRRGDARRALDERGRARGCGGEQPAPRPRQRVPYAPVPFFWSDQYDTSHPVRRTRARRRRSEGRARLGRGAKVRRALRSRRTTASVRSA